MARNKKGSSSARERMRARMDKEKKGAGGGGRYALPQGTNFFKIDKEGRYRLRIVPYTVTGKNPEAEAGEMWYQRTVHVHRNIGPDGRDMIICPKKTVGAKCPICEEYDRIARDPDIDKAVKDKLKTQKREIFNLIDLNDESKGVQFWEVSFNGFGKKLLKALEDAVAERTEEGEDDPESVLDFYMPENGFTLTVRFDQDSYNGNKFYTAESITFKPDEDTLGKKVLSAAVDLDECLQVKTYKEIEKLFFDAEDEPEDEDDKDEKPRGKGKNKDVPWDEDDRGKKPKGKTKPQDDEVDLDEMDWDELLEYIEDQGLDVEIDKKLKKSKDEDALRDLIKEALEEDDQEDKDEPEDPEYLDDLEDLDFDDLMALAEKHDIEVSKKIKKNEDSEALCELIGEELGLEEKTKKPKSGKDKDKDRKPQGKKGKCPHGHEWGADCDEHKECKKCKLWEQCVDAK